MIQPISIWRRIRCPSSRALDHSVTHAKAHREGRSLATVQCLITAMTCASLLMPVVAAHSQTQSIDDTTGPQLALRMGHSSSVVAVAMSPDAHLLATGSFDRTIRLWDVNTKNEIRVLQETAAVTSVLFFDDTHLITGTSNGVLRVWDVRDGSNVISTELDSGIKSIGLSPSALELWVATTLGGISVLSVATLEPKPHANPILPLLLPAYLGVSISRVDNSDGTYTVMFWYEKRAIFWRWDPRSGGIQLGDCELDDSISSAVLLSDGLMALIGTEKGSIHQWSVLDHSEVGRPFVGHKSAISHIDLSPDGSQYVSSGGFSDQVFVRNVRNGSILRVIQPTATSSFHSAIFTRDGRSVAMETMTATPHALLTSLRARSASIGAHCYQPFMRSLAKTTTNTSSLKTRCGPPLGPSDGGRDETIRKHQRCKRDSTVA